MKKIIALMFCLMTLMSISFAEETPLMSEVPFEKALIDESAEVEDSYFDDAVFIGDSLTLSIESRNILQNAKFIAGVGATITNATENAIFPYKGKNRKLMYLLKEYNPQKIYILIGTNTLTYARSGDAIEHYEKMLDEIILAYPTVPIYLVTIPTFRNHAVKKTADKYPGFSNKRILDYNKRMIELGEKKHCFVIDFASELITSKKNIEPKGKFMAPDGIHLSLAGAELFKSLIKTHTIGE